MVKRHGWWLVGFGVVLVVDGCRDTQIIEPCGQLPDDTACPASRGGTCLDRSCTALYACEDRTWVFVADCVGNVDAGTDAPADVIAETPVACDAGVALPAASCEPLQLPDCDVALADACPATICKEGCTGFLRCTPQGWTAAYVAYCDEDGALVR